MAVVALTLLGGFQALRDGAPVNHFRGDKVRALLAYLAVESDRPHARAKLAALLWPDQGDELALRNLAQALVRLRAALGDSGTLLESTRHALRWGGDDAEVDVSAFRRVAGSTDGADLARAAELYRGEFLAGFGVPGCEAFDEWLLLTREQLQQQAISALHTLAEQHLAAERFDTAAQCARHQLALDPLREDAQRQLMRALAGGGDRAAALVAYERCRQTLRDELGVEPDIETVTLAERIRAGDLAPATVRAPAHRLPAQLTPFVGRERELAELHARLRLGDVRLLTLVGAGGMGKTRLALELVRRLLADPTADRSAAPGQAAWPAVRDGMYFVPLAPLTASAAIAPTIAAAIGLPLHGDDPTHALLHFLSTKRLLLVLDNVEHLLDPAPSADAAVELVVELLRSAPHVQLIATSRERLNVRGEHVYLVDGMDHAGTDAAASSAVRLFGQSARRALPGFDLSGASIPDVLRICRLVGGMPLGLELAAAWVETVPLATIAAEIERSADFLAFPWRDAPARQRSMRAVFDWSWQLLNDAERHAVRSLSVFRGGCTRAAAQAVTEAPLRVLTSLTHKSMLRWVQPHGGTGRYEVHELIRQFAAEQLAAAPTERAALEQRHAVWYLHELAARERRLAHSDPRGAALELHPDIDNLEQAWAWAASGGHVAALGSSVRALMDFYWQEGLPDAGERALVAALDGLRSNGAPDADSDTATIQRLSSRLRAYQALQLCRRGRYEQAIAAAQDAIGLGAASAEHDGEARGYLWWGAALYRGGQYHEAYGRLDQALHIVRSAPGRQAPDAISDDVDVEAVLYLGGCRVQLAEYERAHTLLSEARRLARTLDDRQREGRCLLMLGRNALLSGSYGASRTWFQEAMQIAGALGAPWLEGSARLALGTVEAAEGHYTLAHSSFVAALGLFQRFGYADTEADTLIQLGRLDARIGNLVPARTWLDQALQLSRARRARPPEAEALVLLARVSQHAGEAAHARGYAEQSVQLSAAIGEPLRHAEAAVVLGRAYEGLDHLQEASAAYEQALGGATALGAAQLAAEACAGQARIALKAGDPSGALAAVEAVLAWLETRPLSDMDEPVRVYATCYAVLALNDDARAPQVRRRADQVMRDYLDHIEDAEVRRVFLEHVAAQNK